MVELIKCAVVAVMLLCIFFLWGEIPKKLLKINVTSYTENLILGICTYFIIFQCLALPWVLLQGTLSALSKVWMIAMCIITVIPLAGMIRYKDNIISFRNKKAEIETILAVIVMLIMIAVAVFGSILQWYNGWDSSYYIGTMNTSLSTNHFYLVNGNTGVTETELPLRYALSMFYVNFTVLCKLFSIPARLMAYYTMRGLCVVIASNIIYTLGKKVFSNNVKRSAYLVIFWLGINMFWTALHTTAYFLFIRGYEAKGFCANIVLPALLYAFVCVLQDSNDLQNWKYLAVVAYASVPISMSALAIVPIAVGIMGLTIIVTRKELLLTIKRCFICVLPNVCYLVIYLLYTKRIFVIGV